MENKRLIDGYISILKEWNKSMNLIQQNSIEDIIERHFIDSLQISGLLEKTEKIVDIGSGAGFPGIALAINGFENVILCEKKYKKSIFLKSIKNKLTLNISILNDDIYNFKFQNYTCISRAFGSLSKLINIMERIDSPKGVFHKGKDYQKEVEEAKKFFEFDCETIKSITNKESVILVIRNIRRKEWE